MKFVIAAVGSVRKAAEKALLEKYIGQCPWNIQISEIDVNAKLPSDKRLAAEAEKLKAVSKGVVVALDSRGKQLTSEQFAALIAKAQNARASHMTFLIGGQDGLGAGLVKQADHVIAFGAATWPHMLVRAMLAEQIYRAWAILNNHPYHGGH